MKYEVTLEFDEDWTITEIKDMSHEINLGYFCDVIDVKETEEAEDELREKAKRWVSFYRHFPHEFVKDFLNIDLTFYQSLILYQMTHHDNYMKNIK